jgi:hypothetical protein
MLVLFGALLGTAHADTLHITPTTCGTSSFPCTRLSSGDGHILPPEWYAAMARALDGNLRFFRVEVNTRSDVTVSIGGVELSDRYLSSRESERGVRVYYIPAADRAQVDVRTRSRDATYDIAITGVASSPLSGSR